MCSKEAPDRSRTKQSVILIVEDDQATGRLLHNLLEPEGYQTSLAATAAAAWQFLSAGDEPHDAADLILLDLELPDLDGAELIRRLGEGGMPLPPVLVVSAKRRSSVLAAANSIGAVSVIYKPFDIDDLLAKIELALAG